MEVGVGGGRQRHGEESHTHNQGLASGSQGTPPLRCLSWSLTSQGGPSLLTSIPSPPNCCPAQGQACIRLPGGIYPITVSLEFDSGGKESAYNAGDPGSSPGLGRSPGEGNGKPLQYSCLENPMDGGAC